MSWAEWELGGVELGDARRTRRLIKSVGYAPRTGQRSRPGKGTQCVPYLATWLAANTEE